MRPKPYPPEKQRVLAKLDHNALQQFVKEIPPRLLAEQFKSLPAVPGFRPGHATTLQITKIINHLGAPEGSEASREAFQGFTAIWIAWTKGHFALNEVLTGYDNGEDFTDANPKPPNTPLDEGCIDALVRASGEGKVSREDILRFYDYGYFVPDPAMLHKIEMALPQAHLNALRFARELPKSVEELQKSVRELQEREGMSNIHKMLDEIASDLKAVTERTAVLEAYPRDAAGKTDLDALERKLKKVADAVSMASQSLEEGERNHKLLTGRIQECESFQRQAATKVDLLSAEQKILEVAGGVSISAHRADTMEAQLKIAVKSIGDLEVQLSDHVAPRHPELAGASASITTQQRLHVLRSIPVGSRATVVTPFDTLEKSLAALANNVCSLGLAKSAASTLSREIIAAAAAGQVPILSGSVASLLAELIVVTLAAQNGSRISIPVGILSGDHLDHCIGELSQAAANRDVVTIIILEGLNRSAIEAYGESLSRTVANRVLGLGGPAPSTFILGTIVDGPSALPISPTLTELGPILHTDILPWAEGVPPGKLIRGALTQKAWENSLAAMPDSRPHLQQFDECMRAMHCLSCVVWQRGFERSYRRLSAMTQPANPLGLCQSMAYGWLIPRALACGIPLAKFEKALTDGMPGAAELEPRARKLMSFYWPDAGETS